MVRVSNEEPREVTRSLVVLGVKCLPCDFSQNIVSELHVVICRSKHTQEVGQYFREMFIELKVLNDVGIGGKNLTMMFDRNANNRLSRVSNFRFFHVLLVLEYVVSWLHQATVGELSNRNRGCI